MSRHRAAAMLVAVSLAQTTLAQAVDPVPLSVIDWLDDPNAQAQSVALPQPQSQPQGDEPAVATGIATPDVTVRPLDGNAPRQIGLVPGHVTGLPSDLWAGSAAARIIKSLEALKAPDLPAAQSLLYTVLLAETDAPEDGDAGQTRLALARVEKLVALGALDPAAALIEQLGPTASPAHFETWMDISLLVGTEDRACATLAEAPHLSSAYDRRIFCAARRGDYENAALAFGSAQALSLLDPAKLALLDRFLNPDLFEGEAPLPAPPQMDPLSFRLFETVGDPLPTQPLPRPYAVADLRDLAGWKAQLQAAERLTRAGALPDNRLLGIYTDRQPAASGGIWDRVEALQRFETALRTRSPDAVGKTLPPLWAAMKEAELEVAFANLFADALAGVPLRASAARAAFEMRLLSPAYEVAASELDPKAHPLGPALLSVARGEPATQTRGHPALAAIAQAFADAAPRPELIALAKERQLGLAILETLRLLEEGRAGDPADLRSALATLRALGLEDTARRAALQVLLLERNG